MDDQQRILIAGMNGFIGGAITKALNIAGYDVWGIGQSLSNEIQYIQADLSSESDTIRAKKKIPDCSIVIHAAAIAHGRKIEKGADLVAMNVSMVDNIIKVFGEEISHFIFLSSVAVYGEDKRNGSVETSDILKPATKYGISKVISEKRLIKAKFEKCSILRLSPVFDDAHMQDVRKRVFLPVFSEIKIKIIPSPQYSLTSINTVVTSVIGLLSSSLKGVNIYNISDLTSYSQNDITNWFQGFRIIFPVLLIKPFYWLTYLLPKIMGYKIRCYYWKLFESNIYTMNYKA